MADFILFHIGQSTTLTTVNTPARSSTLTTVTSPQIRPLQTDDVLAQAMEQTEEKPPMQVSIFMQ